MTLEEFRALLARRDELERQHRSACEALEEEPTVRNRRRCHRLYDEFADVQRQIDAELATELATERAAEEASP